MNNKNCDDNNNAVNAVIKRAKIRLSGRVQGVGFRPFVYRLAEKYGIKGYVLNNDEGVEISAEGDENALHNFINSLDSDSEKPPLALIKDKIVDYIDFIEQEHFFYKTFEIKESDKTAHAVDKLNLTIPPDIAICGKCLNELLNPSDRRYLYPFINCTDCGPRFTISKELPYDRASTSMYKFTMCPECQTEYKNPLDRRFHAEPNGCFACGPEVEFILSSDISKIDNYTHSLSGIEERTQDIAEVLKSNRLKSSNAVKSLVNLIKEGGIVCVKGIGGFHLMADAANDDALRLLRERKNRPKKPFAVMFKDIGQASEYAYIDGISADLLNSKERPICLLKDRGGLSYYVNCGLKDIGVFLPYAPLHYVIFAFLDGPLVATSANIGGEPIVKENEEAFLKLKNIADGFLIHNRDILRRCDDSVIKVNAVNEYNLNNAHNYGTDADKNQYENHNKTASYFFIRRSRGYVPEPLNLPFNLKRNVLASGAFLKNVFALAYAGEDAGAIVLSQHNGDLDSAAGFANFKNNIEDFEKFYDFKPEAVVYDSHPDYENTKWAKEYAKEKNIKGISLQHHRAHVISCMAENGLGLNEEVFGIAFDGTGYGDDGTIWGGEFFKGKYDNLKRIGSFEKFRLIGGDKAVKSPGRVLAEILFGILSEKENIAAILHNEDKKAGKYNDDNYSDIYIKSKSKCIFKSPDIFKNISSLTGFSEKEISIFHKMRENGLNSPFTSSCGRIFDAVSCLCGFKGDITYEGEAAVYLENLCLEYESKSKSAGEQANSITKANLITKKDCFKYEIRYDNKHDNYNKRNEKNEEKEDFFTVDYYPMFSDIIDIVQTKNNNDDKDKNKNKDKNKVKDKLYKAGFIAERFINTLAMIILDAALKSRCKNVCMSGGVFQNASLRNKAALILKNNGFNVYFNEKIPSNDGGIALGQAVYGGII
ncbi:MAG: carbamoyltransferase HypF [Candidatus Acidulodesulfobacterium acidiphilum]|uniref:acylphosphatase n=1 Tax=Candidatus Acidulodesulfobacterium acidiphilum TaxID=2597224 RepID=A0A520X7K5_9DELT|nr:MAG: carbamoyltransferase HypF [Candidatus Acidulodesulfobacterium acidiphilum]